MLQTNKDSKAKIINSLTKGDVSLRMINKINPPEFESFYNNSTVETGVL